MLDNIFNDATTARSYIGYLETNDGTFQQQVLIDAIHTRLRRNNATLVLDAGCGTGWLTHALSEMGFSVIGCDSSFELLEYAHKTYPSCVFNNADITKSLPYSKNSFDTVVLNMAAQDVPSLLPLYESVSAPLGTHGSLILTIPNPDYAYPIGVWKRGLLGKLLGRKPRLVFPTKPPAQDPKKPVTTFPRPLSDYINQALSAGFSLTHLQGIKSKTDSGVFGLQYQLYRYPLILLLEFKKIS